MTLKELFDAFRSDVDDLVSPQLWTDTDLERYFNWALEELAIEAHYFYDSSTWASLAVTASEPKIIADSTTKLEFTHIIRRARLASQKNDMAVVTMEQAKELGVVRNFDYGNIATNFWETSSGIPAAIVTDYYDDKSLRLAPIPGAADTLSLWVTRLPLRYYTLQSCGKADLSIVAKVTETNQQLMLLTGMKHRAYLKEDPETRDTQLAADNLALFTSGLAEIKHRRKRQIYPTGTIRYGGL